LPASSWSCGCDRSRNLASLTNVTQHALGTAALVTILGTDGELRVDVVDDGPVADSDADPGGHGLLGMRERVGLFEPRSA
jgi:signal transduction histidine kinase